MLESKLGITLVHNREPVGWLLIRGQKIVRFSLPGPHGGRKDLSPGAVAKLIADSRISRTVFERLVSCSLDRNDYETLLADRGLVDRGD